VYRFAESSSFHHEIVAISDGKFVIESPKIKWDTLLLKLTIEPTFCSKWFFSKIVILSEEKAEVQYSAHWLGCSQYINLTPVISEGCKSYHIELHCKGVRIADQHAELLYFKSLEENEKFLVISPHPDDAEIAAFGLYSKFQNVTLVHITAGDSASDRYSFLGGELSQRQLLGIMRVVDTLSASHWGEHVPDVLNLGYPDKFLKEIYEFRDNFQRNDFQISDVNKYRTYCRCAKNIAPIASVSWKELVNDLITVLNKYSPTIIVTPHPMMDLHSDHQYATVALVDALKKWKLNPEIFFYTNHANSSEDYPFGPAGSIESLVPWDNEQLVFKSVYSQTLSDTDIQRKFMALYSMSELRNIDYERNKFLDKGTVKKRIRGCLRKILDSVKELTSIFRFDECYFRRGLMKNEIFYCATKDQAIKHIDFFLNHNVIYQATKNRKNRFY